MRKADKRRLGRARQEQNLKDSINSGLRAQAEDAKRREARKAFKEQIPRAAETFAGIGQSMERLGEAARKANDAIQLMGNKKENA